LEEQNEWLYNEGQQSNRGIYSDRITGIKNKTGNIARRYDSFLALTNELRLLEETIIASTTQLNNLVCLL
jgi:hypothetical protein